MVRAIWLVSLDCPIKDLELKRLQPVLSTDLDLRFLLQRKLSLYCQGGEKEFGSAYLKIAQRTCKQMLLQTGFLLEPDLRPASAQCP